MQTVTKNDGTACKVDLTQVVLAVPKGTGSTLYLPGVQVDVREAPETLFPGLGVRPERDLTSEMTPAEQERQADAQKRFEDLQAAGAVTQRVESAPPAAPAPAPAAAAPAPVTMPTPDATAQGASPLGPDYWAAQAKTLADEARQNAAQAQSFAEQMAANVAAQQASMRAQRDKLEADHAAANPPPPKPRKLAASTKAKKKAEKAAAPAKPAAKAPAKKAAKKGKR